MDSTFHEDHESLSRRRFLALTGAVAGAGLLAGCGATGSNQSATATKASDAYRGQLVISINSMVDKGTQDALSAAYRQRRPDVQIIWEGGNYTPDTYETWLGTQLAATTIRPDIVSGNYAPTYRNYLNFDAYRTTTNPHTHNPWEQDLNWDFYRATNAAGERIMLPTRAVHIAWYYNKELFAKANVTPPTNWSEFVQVCSKLKSAGITPVSSNFFWQVPQWLTETYFDQYHIDWIEKVRAQKGDWNYDPTLDGKFTFDPKNVNIHGTYTFSTQRYFRGIRDGVLRFDTPQIAEMVGNIAQIFPRFASSDFFVTNDSYTPFLQQKVAMIVDGTWNLPQIQKDFASLSPDRIKALKLPAGSSFKPFEWATFENPPMQSSLVNSPVRSIESAAGEYLSIIKKNQAQTNLAVDFLLFWTSQPGYKTFLDSQEKSPSFSPSGPIEVRRVEDTADVQKLFSAVKFLGNAEASYNNQFLSWGGGNTQRDVRNLLKSALDGHITPQAFGTQLQAYLTSNLDTILKQEALTRADLDNPARQPGS